MRHRHRLRSRPRTRQSRAAESELHSAGGAGPGSPPPAPRRQGGSERGSALFTLSSTSSARSGLAPDPPWLPPRRKRQSGSEIGDFPPSPCPCPTPVPSDSISIPGPAHHNPSSQDSPCRDGRTERTEQRIPCAPRCLAGHSPHTHSPQLLSCSCFLCELTHRSPAWPGASPQWPEAQWGADGSTGGHQLAWPLGCSVLPEGLQDGMGIPWDAAATLSIPFLHWGIGRGCVQAVSQCSRYSSPGVPSQGCQAVLAGLRVSSFTSAG